MLELLKFTKSDIDQLISWIPDEKFLMQWAGPKYTYPLTNSQLEETLKLSHATNPSVYIFKSILKNTSITVGHIQIMDIDYTNMEGMLGRVLIGKKEERGKGLGLEMVRLAVKYAFEKINLNRIKLGVFDFNTDAIKCYNRIGFREYEYKKNARYIDNNYWNIILMEMYKNDYILNSN